TKRLVNALMETGYFRVIVPDENLSSMSFKEKTDEAFLRKMLKKYPADIVYAGRLGRQELEDKTNKRFKGMKKKEYVEGEYPIDTFVMLSNNSETLYNASLNGVAAQDGTNTSVLSYREQNDIKSKAFDDYCEKVNNIILDRFNLVRYPVRKDVVKYYEKTPQRSALYMR
ncbi:MAG TPA: hypothetical protein PLQ76_07585, partial [bacterium]|nr:hypothetical protein [bacterium]